MHILLARIDERVRHLSERVDRIENKLDGINNYILKRNNHWRERGIIFSVMATFVAFVEFLRRLFGDV